MGYVPALMPKKNPTQGGRPRIFLKSEILESLLPKQPAVIPAVRSQLDDVLIQSIADLTRQGHPADATCDYLGVSYAAFASWIRKGKGYVEGGQEPKEHKVYGDFYQLYRRAWSEYRIKLANELHAPFVGKDWIRLVTILERRDRRNYGRKELPASNVNAIDPNECFL